METKDKVWIKITLRDWKQKKEKGIPIHLGKTPMFKTTEEITIPLTQNQINSIKQRLKRVAESESEESLKLLQIELALVAQDFNGKKFEFPIDWQMYTDRDPERAQVEKDLLDGKTTIEEVNWAWTDGP